MQAAQRAPASHTVPFPVEGPVGPEGPAGPSGPADPEGPAGHVGPLGMLREEPFWREDTAHHQDVNGSKRVVAVAAWAGEGSLNRRNHSISVGGVDAYKQRWWLTLRKGQLCIQSQTTRDNKSESRFNTHYEQPFSEDKYNYKNNYVNFANFRLKHSFNGTALEKCNPATN